MKLSLKRIPHALHPWLAAGGGDHCGRRDPGGAAGHARRPTAPPAADPPRHCRSRRTAARRPQRHRGADRLRQPDQRLRPAGAARSTRIDEDNVVPLRSFNDNRFIFEEVETIADGLGPTYNAQSCRECHQNVVTGGASQVAEHRTGHLTRRAVLRVAGRLADPVARDASRTSSSGSPFEDDIRTFRISTNTLGDGFVEAIANSTLLAIRDAQPAAMRGTAVVVPVLEANGAARIGRFGWKSQHASLESFSADAYLNEMGITSPLLPEENTVERPRRRSDRTTRCRIPRTTASTSSRSPTSCASTKAPSRGPITADVTAGEAVFARVGCADLPRRRRSPPRRPARSINGGALHGAAGARQQDHPSVQRLPAARHRHRRRHPDPADAGVRRHREPDAHGAAVGAAHAQPADARRPVVHQAGGDSTPRGQANPTRLRFNALSRAQKRS